MTSACCHTCTYFRLSSRHFFMSSGLVSLSSSGRKWSSSCSFSTRGTASKSQLLHCMHMYMYVISYQYYHAPSNKPKTIIIMWVHTQVHTNTFSPTVSNLKSMPTNHDIPSITNMHFRPLKGFNSHQIGWKFL